MIKAYILLLLAVTFTNSGARAASPEGLRYDHIKYGALTFGVAEIDLKRADLKVYWKDESGKNYGTLAAVRESLKADGKNFLMATNSGIYAQDYSPMGLHIERGKQLHAVNTSCKPKGNFFKCPNGIFLITKNGAQVIYTSEYKNFREKAIEATQSGPILLRNGNIHPAFTKNSGNLKLRSGVGVNRDGHVVFAISEGAVEFYEFAMFFKEVLHCQDALYLDGSISTLIVDTNSGGGQMVPFAGIWAATRHC